MKEITGLKAVWQWFKSLFKSKNHKLVVDSKCKKGCCCNGSCLLVYDEKNDSSDDSTSDIEVHENGVIKVK